MKSFQSNRVYFILLSIFVVLKLESVTGSLGPKCFLQLSCNFCLNRVIQNNLLISAQFLLKLFSADDFFKILKFVALSLKINPMKKDEGRFFVLDLGSKLGCQNYLRDFFLLSLSLS